jgi:hypothetical protein
VAGRVLCTPWATQAWGVAGQVLRSCQKGRLATSSASPILTPWGTSAGGALALVRALVQHAILLLDWQEARLHSVERGDQLDCLRGQHSEYAMYLSPFTAWEG